MIDVLDLVRYFAAQGKIKKYRLGGQDIMITCPRPHMKLGETGVPYAHYENTPSMGITVEGEPIMFNCFSCGFSGEISKLVAELLGVDQLKASLWLDE